MKIARANTYTRMDERGRAKPREDARIFRARRGHRFSHMRVASTFGAEHNRRSNQSLTSTRAARKFSCSRRRQLRPRFLQRRADGVCCSPRLTFGLVVVSLVPVPATVMIQHFYHTNPPKPHVDNKSI